jgi:hypothetical protein
MWAGTANCMTDGVTWSEKWVHAFEGPYTLAAKLLLANQMTPRLLCAHIAGPGTSLSVSSPRKSARNLIDGNWLQRRATPSPSFTNLLRSSMLDNTLGALAPHVAGAERFRFCTACIAYGYQSAACQIDALKLCPEHGLPLVDSCRRCGHATLPYSVTSDWSSPLNCRACGQSYDGSDLSRIPRWTTAPTSAAYVMLEKQLLRCKRHVQEWEGLLEWSPPG